MNEIKEAIKNKAVYLSANKIGILNANFIKVAQETQELEPCSDGEREDDEYDDEEEDEADENLPVNFAECELDDDET